LKHTVSWQGSIATEWVWNGRLLDFKYRPCYRANTLGINGDGTTLGCCFPLLHLTYLYNVYGRFLGPNATVIVMSFLIVHSFIRSSLLVALDEPSVDKLCDDALPLKRDLARIVAHWRHSQHYLTRARDCEDATIIHVCLLWRFSIAH
jgi:hypothetical protein